MDKFIKTVGLYVVVGVATAAGASLWNNVLQGKIELAVAKHKNHKHNNTIEFKKGLSR